MTSNNVECVQSRPRPGESRPHSLFYDVLDLWNGVNQSNVENGSQNVDDVS